MVDFTRQGAKSFTEISATTSAFTLPAGNYGVTAKATWGGGSVTLQKLSADGTNYVTALTGFSADGYATVLLPAGTYRFAVATATGVSAEISTIAQA